MLCGLPPPPPPFLKLHAHFRKSAKQEEMERGKRHCVGDGVDESKTPSNSLPSALKPHVRKYTEFRYRSCIHYMKHVCICNMYYSVLCSDEWGRLRAASSKANSSSTRGAATLETRWYYIAPDGSLRGREGYDYVIGEDAVVAYVAAVGQSDASNFSSEPVPHAPKTNPLGYDAGSSAKRKKTIGLTIFFIHCLIS